jgi:hypothetical protein
VACFVVVVVADVATVVVVVLVSAAFEGDCDGDDGGSVHIIAQDPSLHLHQPG